MRRGHGEDGGHGVFSVFLRELCILCALFLFFSSSGFTQNFDDSLIKAAVQGSTSEAALLLQNGAPVNAKHPLTGWTALTAAAYYGHVSTVKLLVENGADVDVRDKKGGTPLMKAVTLGPYQERAEMLNRKEEIVRTLLDRGADATARDRFGHTVWQMAWIDGYGDMIAIFDEYGVPGVREFTLIEAIERGEPINDRLKRPVNLHSPDDDGRTVWGHAALMGNTETLKLLLEAGADPNARLEKDYTGLMVATMRNDVESVRLLLEHGADTTLLSEDNTSAIDIATRQGYSEIVNLLQQAADN